LVEQHGFGRGTTYRLSVSRDLPSEQAPQAARTPRDRILDYVRWHGSINNSECRELLGVGIQRASYLLKKMVAEGKLTPVGSRRNRRYRPHE
jgi:DNA-binding MarR family transcriptional regulator